MDTVIVLWIIITLFLCVLQNILGKNTWKEIGNQLLQGMFVGGIASIIVLTFGCAKSEKPIQKSQQQLKIATTTGEKSPERQADSSIPIEPEPGQPAETQEVGRAARRSPRPISVSRAPSRRAQGLATHEGASVSLGGPILDFRWRYGAAYLINIHHGFERMNLDLTTNYRITKAQWNSAQFKEFINSKNGKFFVNIWRIRKGEFSLVEVIEVINNSGNRRYVIQAQNFQFGDVIIVEQHPGLFFEKTQQNLVISPVLSFIQNKSNDPTTLPGIWMKFRGME